jgi:AcrR family transcriptional regulator/DNA-binding MarR family transcriptional regulator
MASPGQVRMRRPGTPGPRGGGIYVSELQRRRLLDATFVVVAEQGYRRMTVRRVCGRAGVSNKTFYDLFSDREDCFLAAFDQAIDELAAAVRPVYDGEREWTARIRAGLGALLSGLDREPELRQIVFVEALGAGPRVLRRRAQVAEDLATAIDSGRAYMRAGREPPPLTGEGLVGAAFGVIYARLLQDEPGSLTALLNPLMATIVLPYRGHAAAARELNRPLSQMGLRQRPADKTRFSGPAARTSEACAHFRLTVRTQMVLAAVAELGVSGVAPSNREVSDAAEISDQGQISKLLARLEGLGLLVNTGGETQGVPNAWSLTPEGEEIVRASAAQRQRFMDVSRRAR